MGTRRKAAQRCAGQETLQTILVVAFVLLPLLVAIFTFGSLIHLYIGEQAAAARGARAAGASGVFSQTEYSQVVDELNSNGLSSSACQVRTVPYRVSLGAPISVTVTCPQHLGIPFLLDTDINVQSTFVARGEVNQ